MPRRQHALPALPDHDQREVIDSALDGSYRLVRFTTPNTCGTLAMFFGLVLPLLLETVEILTTGNVDLKICPFLLLLMKHVVHGEFD